MGPMGLARSGGQILYDLAIKDVDTLVGSRERYAALLYNYLIDKDEPTDNFIRLFNRTYEASLLQNNEVPYMACLARIATVEMLGKGSLIEDQKNTN